MSSMYANASAKIDSINTSKISIIWAGIIIGIIIPGIRIINRIIGICTGLQPVPVRIPSSCPRNSRNRVRYGKRV